MKKLPFLLSSLLLVAVAAALADPTPAANTFLCSYSTGSCILSATGNTCLSGYSPSNAVCINLHDQPSCEQPHPCILPGGTACSNTSQCFNDFTGADGSPAGSYENYAGCASAPNGQVYCAVDGCGYTGEFCCAGSTCDLSTDTCLVTATGLVCTTPATPPGGPSPWGNCGGVGIVSTGLGCLFASNPSSALNAILWWGIGLGGGVAFLMIVYAGFQMATAAGDPKRVKASQELLTAALGGLILIVISIALLNFLGVTVLGLDLFGFKLNL